MYVLSISDVFKNFWVTLTATTLIFISRGGSAISYAQEEKLDSICLLKSQ